MYHNILTPQKCDYFLPGCSSLCMWFVSLFCPLIHNYFTLSDLFNFASPLMPFNLWLAVNHLHYPNLISAFYLCSPAILGWKHCLLWWTGQLFPVHHGHGPSIHEGRGSETSASELSAASSPESSQGENQD